MCRVAVAVCLALAAASLDRGGTARADSSDSYVAVTVNGEPVAVEATLAAGGFDVSSNDYTVCSDGVPAQTLTLTGWSVQRLLQAAGTTPEQVSSITVPRIASSGDVVLHPADYDPAAPGYPTFPEGPALLVRRTTGASQSPADDFFRPYRSPDCASDPNADDHVTTPVGTALAVQIASGTQLQVSDTVDHSQVSVGQDARFTGQVANPPAGETLNYRWQFGDGTLGSGQTVTHAFAGPGNYPVLLTVDSGAAAGGAAAPLTVTVGSEPGRAGPSRSPTPAKTEPGTTARPTATPARTTVLRHRTAPAGPMTPAPSTPLPTSAPIAGTVVAPRQLPSALPSATPLETVVPTPAGQFVTGRAITLLPLVRAAATPPVSQEAALRQALGPRGTAVATASPDWAPAAAVAGVLLCLAAGAGGELLSSRVRR